MTRLLLIAYEPLLFGLAVLGWAGWEFWSLRRTKADRPPSEGAPPPRKAR